MGTKSKRYSALRSIIESGEGSTHEEIRNNLNNMGITVSQSTLSRDLREIGAVKVPGEGGLLVYRLNDSGPVGYQASGLAHAMNEFCLGYEEIGNFMIIKTRPGNAGDLCLVIDSMNWDEIAGTIAGDDTILIIARNSSEMKIIKIKLDRQKKP